jgi:hypothetical protein
MNTSELNLLERKKLAIKKILPQVGDSAEERLMFAVVNKAISDAFLPVERRFNKKAGRFYDPNETKRKTGLAYLRTDMPHAVIIGIDPQWIRDILTKLELI